MLPCACLNRTPVFAPLRRHKVPPLRFAPVGMTELLWEGIAQAEREEFIEEEEMDARMSGCLASDAYPVRGPTLVAKNATRMGHPRSSKFVEKL